MAKINEYPINALPELDDKLIGTRIGGNPVDGTYNFTIAELLTLISSNLTAVSFKLSNVPEYADNAAALSADLTIGQVYRTGDLLKIVH
jgi:hypothetical protein